MTHTPTGSRALRSVPTGGLASRQVTSYRDRKSHGDAGERLVRDALESRGYEVTIYGQQRLGPIAQAILRSRDIRLRWDPDYIVARGWDLAFVDAKYRMNSRARDEYYIESSELAAHRELFGEHGIPVFYVYDDLSVVTFMRAIMHGRPRAGSRRGSGTPMHAVPKSVAEPFNKIFGFPDAPATLRAAA